MKRITFLILAIAAILAGSVSCSRINDIDERLTEVENSLSKLENQIAAGAYITSVDQTEEGCTFTLSNGQTYKVTNGKDGEPVIADVKIEENYVVITLKNGEIMRLSYQNPLSLVTLNIVPDYDDGTVCEPETVEAAEMKLTSFYLDIAVIPAKYAEILSDNEKFIHKAVFSPVRTKSGFDNAFTVSPKFVTYVEDAPVPFLKAFFDLEGETAALLADKNTAYTVSYSIEDKDGVHGAATAFVAISSDKDSGGYSTTIEGALLGEFSVSESKQVCFSRGNLYYDGAFKFEAKQYGFHGYDFDSKTWGLFGWSTSKTNYGMSTSGENSSYSGYFVDWGKAIGDGETWRTLTKDEWTYLLETRPNAAEKYGFGRVYGIYGLIILPDEFTDPMKNNGSGPFKPDMGYSNFYTLGGNWEAMESAGAVFLPIAGYRGGSNVMYDKDFGIYWSSSADGEENAYEMDFQLNSIRPAVSDARRRGHSVRLVTNVCTVTFDMNGKTGTVPESLKKVPDGSKITKPSDPTAEGYTFLGWYKDKACTMEWNFNSDQVTSNITLYAKWRINVDGALDGVFTVNDSGKKVHFSKGNLYCNDGSGTIFNFETNQYDYSTDIYHGGHLFWSKSASAACNPKLYPDEETSDSDIFFTNETETTAKSDFTVNGVKGKYRTLSSDEWAYLLNKHEYKLGVTVCEKANCLVIAPDNWNVTANPLKPSYDATSWAAAQAAGLVCLPEAGYRKSSAITAANGYYWSSNLWRGYVERCSVLFFGDSGYTMSFQPRDIGCAVRLVTDAI